MERQTIKFLGKVIGSVWRERLLMTLCNVTSQPVRTDHDAMPMVPVISWKTMFLIARPNDYTVFVLNCSFRVEQQKNSTGENFAESSSVRQSQ
jgi:hypothetical protein